MTLKQQLDDARKGVALVEQLLSTYPRLEADRNAMVHTGFLPPSLILCDAALAGEVLGKDGWTRETNKWGKCFIWCREINGVRVRIDNAEPFALPEDDSPVPPSAFPLLLQQVAD